MRYFDDTNSNERQKEKNGEREKITQDMLNLFLGGDNPDGEAWEMLLDILNNQYPLDECAGDIVAYYEDNKEQT